MSARVRRGSTTSLAANWGQPSTCTTCAHLSTSQVGCYLVDSFLPTAFCLLLYEPLRAAAMDCPQPSTNRQLPPTLPCHHRSVHAILSRVSLLSETAERQS